MKKNMAQTLSQQNGLKNQCIYRVFRHQAAGHEFHGLKPNFITGNDNYIYKLTGSEDIRHAREEQFYKHISTSNGALISPLKHFVPLYLGTFDISINEDTSKYLKLENVLSGFRRPCVLDVKLGKVTYDPFASIDKITSQSAKYIYQKEVGFRLDGAQIYDPQTEKFNKYSRTYFQNVNPEEMPNAISEFLGLKNYPERQSFVRNFIEKLEEIKNWFQVQTCFQFFASSLLFCYDGDPMVLSNGVLPKDACRLKLVDFGHTYLDLDEVIDDNCLYGIDKLISFWKQTI